MRIFPKYFRNISEKTDDPEIFPEFLETFPEFMEIFPNFSEIFSKFPEKILGLIFLVV